MAKKSDKSPKRVAPDIYTSYFMSTKIYLEVQDTLFLKFLKFRKNEESISVILAINTVLII
jgi:hypothetical protein